jgi:hypothetical protein
MASSAERRPALESRERAVVTTGAVAARRRQVVASPPDLRLPTDHAVNLFREIGGRSDEVATRAARASNRVAGSPDIGAGGAPEREADQRVFVLGTKTQVWLSTCLRCDGPLGSLQRLRVA